MNKQEWLDLYFSDEAAECLPLPDRHDETATGRGVKTLQAGSFDAATFAAGVLCLLGVYGGIFQAGATVRGDGKYFPIREVWEKDAATKDFVAGVAEKISVGSGFDWTKEEVAEVSGQPVGRGVALVLSGEIPANDAEDFALIFSADAGKLSVNFSAKLYAPEFVETLVDALNEILKTLPAVEKLSEVKILSPAMLKILDGFNANERDFDRSVTVVDLFRESAKKFPENIAVVFEEKSYTYAETNDLSDRLAARLSRLGAGRGDVVSVFIPRSEYMVIASLGVLKTGAAYQPLDPTYPDERLSFMTEDAGVKIIVAADELLPRLKNFEKFSGEVVKISEIADLPAPGQDTIAPPRPDDLFTLIYTSGTTGVPKGVKLLHRNLTAYAAWYRRFFAPTPESRVTCYNSYGFDGCLSDIYPSLTVGAAVVVISEEKKLDLPAVAEIIRKNHVYLCDLPSQVGRQFALTMDCPELKYIVGGGEKLIPFKPVYPYIFANQYGPTESTVAVTCKNVTTFEAGGTIGTPMDNTAIYVVDASGRRVPPGALGELWVAGVQVTGGYLNRPEKTREVFVPNPFDERPDYATAYRTGDVVRWLANGEIEFVGRRDGLVKIRGFRVELSEVDGVIRDFPGVKNVAVIARDNPAGGKFIAAYVVADEPIDRTALENFIRERKPPYMIPAAITQIPSIPVNQNGKLNVKALPAPEIRESTTEYVAPSNEVEKTLAEGFAVALGLERVSATEDFFAAGGDSLSVVRLLSECRELQLNFKLVFEGKTPAGIAKLLAKRAAKSGKKRDTHFFGPLHQVHYAWGNEVVDGYGVHCDAQVWLSAATDLERLAAAIETVLKLHPNVDGRLVPVGEELRWTQGDLKDLRPAIERVSAAEFEEIRPKLRLPMNKPGMRMFNVRLFEIAEPGGEPSKVLYFDFLHPIIDGASLEIFLMEVDAVYGGASLEPEEFGIFDYYDEIEDRIFTDEYEREREWNENFTRSFTEKLNEFPGDLEAGDENETFMSFDPLGLNFDEIDEYTKKHGVSEGSLMSAAFGLLQGHRNGEQAAVALTIYNGRDDVRFERTVGAIYRHHPLCARWTDEMTAEEYVKQTQENILLCRRHALYDADPVPLINAFIYQSEDIEEFEFCDGVATLEEVIDYAEENFEVYIHRREDDVYILLTYNTKEYSDEFIDRFKKNYSLAVKDLMRGVKPADIVKKF